MNEQDSKKAQTIEEMLIEMGVKRVTPDEMFDELGDLIPTPENPEGSITVHRERLHGSTSTTRTGKTSAG